VPEAKLLLFIAAVAACLAVVVLLRSRQRGGPMLTRQHTLPHLKGSLDANRRGRGVDLALGEEVLNLLEGGRRAEVLALVRERTGWGEEEAEQMVAKLEKWKRRLES
jgi:hypothetical protein